MTLEDFHVHTAFCDGRDTPEELAEEALRRGFTALGFSGHAYMDDGRDWGMSREGASRYRQEIAALKKRCPIPLLCGIEQDYYAPDPPDGYDYVIGSVHGMRRGGRVCEVDSSLALFEQAVAEDYGGDVYALIEDDYDLAGGVADKTRCEIIGHIDLVTKWQEEKRLFDEQHPRYRAAAESAVRRLIPSGALFEINVGAMTRGCRTSPYPAPPLLRLIRELGGEIILSGDCHDRRALGRFLPEAAALARACGFMRCVRLVPGGREYVALY